MKKVKIRLNGREKEGFLITKTYRKIRQRKIGDRSYRWEERLLIWYIPKGIKSKSFLIVPLNEE